MKRAIWKVWNSKGRWTGYRLMKVFYEDFKCKLCGSKDVVKYGKLRGIQRWWCKKCKRKFADNDALPGMRTPVEQVSSAVHMYYEGMSLQAIRRHLQQEHNSFVSDSNIYAWVVRFTNEAIKKAKEYQPKVGDTWIADETVLKVEGKKMWFWDIIDAKTRFLIASHLSATRGKRDAQRLMEKAAERAGKVPKVVATDRLNSYLDGIESAFGADTKHLAGGPFKVEGNTNLIERFHGTLKARTKVMRGMKRRDTARLFAEGWLIHYNFFRPHESLKDKTPAEAAGVKFPYRHWKDIIREPKLEVRRVEVTETPIKGPSRPRPIVASVAQTAKPKRRSRARGDIYEGHGMLARRPFEGAKRRKGRIL